MNIYYFSDKIEMAQTRHTCKKNKKTQKQKTTYCYNETKTELAFYTLYKKQDFNFMRGNRLNIVACCGYF